LPEYIPHKIQTNKNITIIATRNTVFFIFSPPFTKEEYEEE